MPGLPAWLRGRGPAARFALLPLLFLVPFAAVIAWKAWVCDDAYITFRTIDNFTSGYGLRWNVLERVQTYTHPLWMFLLSGLYVMTGEPFYTSIALSLALSFGAALVFAFRLAGSVPLACLGISVLTVSRAFTDYSTSGLENPLTHLLVALFLWVFLAGGGPGVRGVLGLSLIAALMGLTRMDALLILLPALVCAVFMHPTPGALAAGAAGMLPLLGWELFSLFYYGVPFPNTAYAKLGTGIGGLVLAGRGVEYLQNSFRFDPLTLVATVAGSAAPILARRWREAAVSAGIVLYTGYVVLIGGDFMSGRFLTVPLLAALTLGCRVAGGPARSWALVGVVAFAWGLLPDYSPFLRPRGAAPGVEHPAIDSNGIADERSVYEQDASLRLAPPGEGPWPSPHSAKQAAEIRASWESDSWMFRLMAYGIVDKEEAWPPGAFFREMKEPPTPVAVRGNLGYLGYYAGPGIHILDIYALGDPLLARLPAVDRDPLLLMLNERLAHKNWRVGHFVRKVPLGYVETLITGENRIRDPRLAAYYERIALVTRGPLLDRRRLAGIWDLNFGLRDRPLSR
jgi:arabinofuranosyltransferase